MIIIRIHRQWCSLGTTVSSTNKTDRHDIAEILLKVPLNTITINIYSLFTLLTKSLIIMKEIK
jgi:hypothetical protein